MHGYVNWSLVVGGTLMLVVKRSRVDGNRNVDLAGLEGTSVSMVAWVVQ